MDFGPGDLYVYMPGFPVRILSISADYEGLCLLADESTTYETPAFRELVHTARFPLMLHGSPRLELGEEDARRVECLLLSLRDFILRPSAFNEAALSMLYSVFLLQLAEVRQGTSNSQQIPRRSLELFIGFYTLLRQHFAEQHHIGFYAERLNITPIYLSRVVRQATGRTVVECVNQMLVAEAMWLLSTSGLTVGQIADRLHFSSAAAFNKFFVRMRGLSPGAYRKR